MPDTPPLLDLLARRWSPRDFDPRPVDPAVLRSIFEAARSSFSCFNEQPWRFIVATKEDPKDYERIFDCLVPKNQAWAKDAWVLGISFGKKTFSHNDSPNRYNLHDAGAALMCMAMQATAHGLYIHGMGGYDPARALSLGVPDGYEPGAAFAIGHLREGVAMPERNRKPLTDVVFGPGWLLSSIAGA